MTDENEVKEEKESERTAIFEKKDLIIEKKPNIILSMISRIWESLNEPVIEIKKENK